MGTGTTHKRYPKVVVHISTDMMEWVSELKIKFVIKKMDSISGCPVGCFSL